MPAVKLKLIDCASVPLPELTVVAFAEALVTLTTGAPVTDIPAVELVFQTVLLAVTLIMPVPNARVLVIEPLLLNTATVRLLLLRSSVPWVSTIVSVKVAAPFKRKVPPGASIVVLNVIVFPALVKSIVPRPENVCVDVPVKVTPEPRL